MTHTTDNVRLIKHHNCHGDSWVCQQSFPDGTWKNRQIWKPVTRPLAKAEMIEWLAQQDNNLDADAWFS